MTSALDSLRALPEIFTNHRLCQQAGMSARQAAVYLHRWKARGLIEPAGERLGVYFNLLKLADGVTSLHRDAVLRHVYPTAVLCGESVLHQAGWVTQIPTVQTVAVLARPTYTSVHGYEVRGKPAAWFRALADDIMPSAHPEGLRTLSPAASLVDLYATPGAWHPDPDDLYLDVRPEADPEAGIEIQRLLRRLDLPTPWQLKGFVANPSSRRSPCRP